jgi:aspartate racemase
MPTGKCNRSQLFSNLDSTNNKRMKTIGLIGGISWYSTIDYYRIINENVNKRLGNNNSAIILLYSVNYNEIVTLTHQGDWAGNETIISTAAKKLENAGAGCILLCANTMHIIADKVQSSINIPLLHIADIILKAIVQRKIKKVLLLGTKYTMQADFYANRLNQNGVEVIIPGNKEIEKISNTIYNEMGKGVLLPSTKKMYLDIINKHIYLGVQGVILGCTEIPLLIKQDDCLIPVFDTTLLHAVAATDFALS